MKAKRPPPFLEPYIAPPLTNDAAAQIRHMTRMSDKAEERWQHQILSHIANEAYETEARKVGQPRLAPDIIREMVARKSGDDVARSMIVFGAGGDVFNLRLAPYFRPPPTAIPPDPAIEARRLEKERKDEETRRRAFAMRLKQEYDDALSTALKCLLLGIAFIIGATAAYATGTIGIIPTVVIVGIGGFLIWTAKFNFDWAKQESRWPAMRKTYNS